MEATIDRYTYAQAAKLLTVSIRTMQRRCKELDIQPEREGREAFITKDQMEQLRSHKPQSRELVLGATQQQAALALEQRQVDAIELVQAIAQLLLPKPETDVLQVQRSLQEVANNGWLISTAQLSALTGLAPRTINNGGDRFGFRFVRMGREWQVKRQKG